MKKVAILTLNNYNNYGNRLQNYAAQEVITSLGFNVETVKNYNNPIIEKRVSRFSKIKGKTPRELVGIFQKKLKSRIQRSYLENIESQRTEVFKKFTSKYIKETNFNITDHNIMDGIGNSYDYFVTGSDQVWNPTFRHGSHIDFLTFAPKHKRVAYSASFGVSRIPEDFVENYKVWLSEFSHLSVREEAGAKIIKELTNRDATVLVDPTMMLTKEQWLSIAEEPISKPVRKYLLTYFLGEISREKRQFINAISRENDLEVVDLKNYRDKSAYLAGPSEFIHYINSASVVMTDSFHGAVFSILMETPFVVFNREGSLPSMNSRMDTLLSTLKLTSRIADNIERNEQVFHIDFSHTVPILEAERKKAYDFLKTALNVAVLV